MGNCFNVEQGQHGLLYPGRKSFQALTITSEGRTGITPCETLCPLATCCVSGVRNLLGSCSGFPKLCLSLLILHSLPGFASSPDRVLVGVGAVDSLPKS